MSHPVDSVLVLVLLINFLALGTSRLAALIRAVAAQGVLLGLTPVLIHGTPEARTWFVALATMAIKGLVIPWLLVRATREVRIRREIEPLVGYVPCLLLGAAGTGLAVVFAGTLPLAARHANLLIVPASFSTILTGFLILMTRRKAITQVAGYLVLDNGIFIFGLLLLESMPLLVEMGALLDLFVGVFVMGIIIHHINREFSSLDTRHLTALRE